MSKYLGYDDFNDFEYFAACGGNIFYEGHSYDLYHNGLGYCIQDYGTLEEYVANGRKPLNEKTFETAEEMLDNYVFFDGVKMRDIYERDYDMIPTGKIWALFNAYAYCDDNGPSKTRKEIFKGIYGETLEHVRENNKERLNKLLGSC